MNLDKKIIAKVIKEARKKAGLTQFQLAEKIGISEKHISKLETGRNYPSLDNFVMIMDALNLSMLDFSLNAPNEFYPNKIKLQKIINASTEQQIDTYLDVILSLQKHV